MRNNPENVSWNSGLPVLGDPRLCLPYLPCCYATGQIPPPQSGPVTGNRREPKRKTGCGVGSHIGLIVSVGDIYSLILNRLWYALFSAVFVLTFEPVNSIPGPCTTIGVGSGRWQAWTALALTKKYLLWIVVMVSAPQLSPLWPTMSFPWGAEISAIRSLQGWHCIFFNVHALFLLPVWNLTSC